MTGIDTRLAGETSTYRTFPMDAGLRDQTGVRGLERDETRAQSSRLKPIARV